MWILLPCLLLPRSVFKFDHEGSHFFWRAREETRARSLNLLVSCNIPFRREKIPIDSLGRGGGQKCMGQLWVCRKGLRRCQAPKAFVLISSRCSGALLLLSLVVGWSFPADNYTFMLRGLVCAPSLPSPAVSGGGAGSWSQPGCTRETTYFLCPPQPRCWNACLRWGYPTHPCAEQLLSKLWFECLNTHFLGYTFAFL